MNTKRQTAIRHSPTVVVFDLDDTLLDHRHAERSALADLHREHADTLGRHELAHVQATYHAHNVPLWRDYGKGIITADQLKRLRFEHTLAALEIHQLDAETFGQRYLDLYAEHWTWIEGAEACVPCARRPVPRRHSDQRIHCAAKSQAGSDARTGGTLRRRSGSPEEVGHWKPHTDVFAHATDELARALNRQLEPSDILYVGDSYHSDVLGGTGFGWRVAWFRGDADRQPEGAWAFSEWAELLRQLELAA